MTTPYQVILLAVDGSKHSEATIHAAAELARVFRSMVVVVHARQIIQSTVVVGAGALSLPTLGAEEQMAQVEKDLDADARNLVDRVASELNKQSIQTRAMVVSGRSTAKSILKAAQDCEADLIVIGSRGLSDLSGLLLGSVAHQVVQHAHCPVLVIRSEG